MAKGYTRKEGPKYKTITCAVCHKPVVKGSMMNHLLRNHPENMKR